MAGKILIVGAAGWKNVGDDLIAKALVEWAQSSGASVQIAGGPHQHASEGRSPLILSGKLRDKLNLARAVLSSDYVVIGGGGLLDDRAPNFYRPFTRVAKACRLFRRKYAFVGIGVGPIQNTATRAEYRAAAEGADCVLVRDQASVERLRECGVKREIGVVSDPVLWGQGLESSSGFDLAVNLRRWHSHAAPKVGYLGPCDDVVVEAVADAVNAEYGKGAKVALVSMSGYSGDDDATILERLRERLHASTTEVYSNSPEEVSEALAQAEMVLSMRLHACLIAAAHGKRVVGLAYDPKVMEQGRVHGFSTLTLDGEFAGAGAVAGALAAAQPARPVTVAPAPLW